MLLDFLRHGIDKAGKWVWGKDFIRLSEFTCDNKNIIKILEDELLRLKPQIQISFSLLFGEGGLQSQIMGITLRIWIVFHSFLIIC